MLAGVPPGAATELLTGGEEPMTAAGGLRVRLEPYAGKSYLLR
jgi:hypothetical protein